MIEHTSNIGKSKVTFNKTVMRPAITDEAETGADTKGIKQKTRTLEMKIVRTILRITLRVVNTNMREMCSIQDVARCTKKKLIKICPSILLSYPYEI